MVLFYLFQIYLHPRSQQVDKKSVGDVAQLVEQWTENPCVDGSIPPITTHNK